MTEKVYRWIKCGVCIIYKEFGSVAVFVCRKVHVLHNIGVIKKVRKLDGLRVEWIVN